MKLLRNDLNIVDTLIKFNDYSNGKPVICRLHKGQKNFLFQTGALQRNRRLRLFRILNVPFTLLWKATSISVIKFEHLFWMGIIMILKSFRNGKSSHNLDVEVNPRLAKRPLKTNGRLANRCLTSLLKEATGSLQCLPTVTTRQSLSRPMFMVVLVVLVSNNGYWYGGKPIGIFSQFVIAVASDERHGVAIWIAIKSDLLKTLSGKQN